GIDTVFPPPSRAKTTRERFTSHSENPACKGCHEGLDALGYTFESFDAIGAGRTTENGKSIDTRARVEVGGEALSFVDSLDLAQWLARNPDVSDCYLRQAFRYFTGQSDPRVETELMALTKALPAKFGDDLFEGLIAYVRS